MKKGLLFLVSIPLTLLFISKPPHVASGRSSLSQQQDTTRRKDAESVNSTGIDTRLDSIASKAARLKEQTKVIKQGSEQIERDTRRLLQEVTKDPARTDTIKDTVRITYAIKVPVPVEAVDSAMIGRTWWGQMFQHVKRCRVGKIFKPKQWGKGKF